MTSRMIQMDMTWTGAAQIIAAALENGTGEGRAAARQELHRMAGILDRLRAADGDPHSAAPVDLFEVIADHPEHGPAAFGQTFNDQATADAYTRHLQRHGYNADRSPAFETVATLAAALDSARDYFSDDRLKADAP